MAKEKQLEPRESGLERLLAPIVGAVLLVFALFQTEREKRAEPARPQLRVVAPRERDEPEFTGIKARLARIRGFAPVLRVQQRYSELRGNNLAAAVTFQTFVSLFPLMLVIVAVVGFVSANSNTDVAGQIISHLGLTGDSADAIGNAVRTAERNRKATAPVGLIALLWSGLGLVNAFQFAFNQVWQVDERGLKDKAVGIMWLAGAALLFVGTAAITTVLNWLPGVLAPLGIVLALTVNVALWLWTFKVLPNRNLPWRALMPGAIVGAIGMEVLKVVGGIYVPRAVANSSALYGSLGVVFAVLAWLLFFGRLSIYAAVVNVVRWERRVGTIQVAIEVPAGDDVRPSAEVSRVGRLERDDIAT